MRPIIVMGLFLGSALFHGLALHWPNISVAESPPEHVLFVIINAWLAMEVMANHGERGRLYVMLSVLSIHQIAVHGSLLVISIAAKSADFQSLGVLVGLGTVWGLLLVKDSYGRC